MKHDLKVTIILIAIFLLAQVVGLFLVKTSLPQIKCEDTSCAPTYPEDISAQKGFIGTLQIIVGVAIGTAALLLIAKYRKVGLWKTWFFIAVSLSIFFALRVIMPEIIALLIGLGIAGWKLWRPNIYIYNIAEILVYSGLAVIIVPFLKLYWMLALLGLISIYDYIAVWRSGHMVTMAKFITESNAFAGIVVPYDHKKKKVIAHMKQAKTKKKSSAKQAILGGGDIAFPLLFAGIFLEERASMLVSKGLSHVAAVNSAFWVALVISLFAGIAVSWLLLAAKKDKFYPAMPFITAGCVVGWLVTFLI